MVVLVVYGVSVITFLLSRVIPGNPVMMWVGAKPRKEQIEWATKELGLDKPLVVQYLVYVKNLAKGDLGVSLRTKRNVSDDLSRCYAATFELVAVAMVLTFLVGIPMGIISATHKNSFVDHINRAVSISGVAMPIFWLGMLLQLILHGQLRLAPLQGRIGSEIIANHPIAMKTGFYLVDSLITGNWPALWSALSHILLPAITLSFASLAVITRISRSCMLEVLGEDYIQTSRAYGVSEKIINYKYALKNALIPTVTVIGLDMGLLLGGSFIVESIFDWPGLGRYAVLSIITKDFPGIMGTTVLYALVYVSVNLLVDFLYFFIDPRIKIPTAKN